jgi:Na+-transporting NADH:ubiquinone oxidoreductase subunit NqrD
VVRILQLLKKLVFLTDMANMKSFFQGLVFGVVVMYGYLNYSADLLGPFRGWFDGAGNGIKHDRMRKEADKVLHSFLFQHDTWDSNEWEGRA